MTDKHIITIAALGPDAEQMLTSGALCAMRKAQTLILRTRRHAVAQLLAREGTAFETLDGLYDECEDFDELCRRAADAILSRAREGLCYAVSDPASDATVRELARREGVCLSVVGAASLRDGAAYAVIPFGVNTENLREITALSTLELRPQADCPQVITEIDNRCLASDVKLWLAGLFDDETTVYFLENAACSPACALPIPLCELDRQAHYDHRTAVLVPAVSVYERSRATYEDFVQVVARLRAPGGCPWDRAQTHHTLRQFMIEEACEAAEAMDAGDEMKLADELGDVLLQVVLNSAIGAEHRAFDDRDVTSMAARKMITRHEHVFGRAKAKSAEDVGEVWENAKRRERGEQTPLDRAREVSPLLPALMRAQKVQKRLFGDGERAAALEDVGRALEGARAPGAGEEELAKLLEACAALAQAMGLDAETALRSRTARRLLSGGQ
ncbi:MAG: MazG nucleotide pyrophosphohydrolase domain-containing protein [Clostridia bacterium]|nr:MazG nucleotide pyrophosphohydrolase domain-containing protein [Clostridia bacterium]